MGHKLLPLILCGILLLSACETGLPDDPQEESTQVVIETPYVTVTEDTADESQLKEDLCNSDIFKETAIEYALALTDFKVIKRQTTPEEKIDKVWVAVDAETSSADYYYKVNGHLECVMTYGLYNNGWILDEISTEGDTAWTFKPLGGYSDAIVADMLIDGGELLENTVDLDNRTQYITYRKTMVDQYCKSEYVIQEIYIFSYGAEWRWNDRRILDKNETWNIEGKFFFPDYRADLWLKFDGSTFQWDDGSADLANGLVCTNNLPLKQYALSYLPCYYVNEVQNGYSIEFDGVDWSDIRYATTRWPIFLIGKNHIYRWSLDQEIDHGTKIVHYYGFEELIPDNRSNSSYSSGAEAAYIPGAYTGTGSGWDNITVSVTVDEYSITGIKVIEDNETVGVGSPRPLNQMIESILKKNSTDVDTVSGATITSNGVIAAVKDALTKAQKP